MGHHYVPQFYLRGFSVNNVICVHDQLLRRTFVSQPKTIANETNMYSYKLEQHFADNIEGPANLAIKTIRERKPLTEVKRLALANYVIALWKRVPRGRLLVAELMPEAAAEVRSNFHQKLDAAVAANPSLSQLAASRRDVGDQIISDYESDPPPDIWQQSLAEDSNLVVSSLMSMEWRFLHSDREHFITCDNPVFFFAHEGIGRPTSELTIPFSSTIALWANRHSNSGSPYVRALPAIVKELNRRSARNATRFLYSERNEPWMLPFACKGQYSLNRLR